MSGTPKMGKVPIVTTKQPLIDQIWRDPGDVRSDYHMKLGELFHDLVHILKTYIYIHISIWISHVSSTGIQNKSLSD